MKCLNRAAVALGPNTLRIVRHLADCQPHLPSLFEHMFSGMAQRLRQTGEASHLLRRGTRIILQDPDG